MGNFGTIYEVQDAQPARVYKVIHASRVGDGNEVVISKLAGEIGIGTTFYSAFAIALTTSEFVVIEMEKLGETLNSKMLALAKEGHASTKIELANDGRYANSNFETKLNFLNNIQIEQSSCSSIERRASHLSALDSLFSKREKFYLSLFGAVKKLAENKVTYIDTNPGNIIHNSGKELQLIGFHNTTLEESVEAARLKVIERIDCFSWFAEFKKLDSLSLQSRELIQWFEKK